MKVVLKKTGAIRTGLYVVVIRDPDDPLADLPFTMCIKDSSNNVVSTLGFTFTPGIDPDVKEYVFDVSSLSDGVYKVEIYNWINCDSPLDLVASYYIHKVSGGSTLTLSGSWDYSNNRWFILYAYDGKLFFIYDVNVSGVPIPIGIPVYAEITDGSGNAFVGSVTASFAVTYVEPNMKVPFMATFTIKLDRPRATDVATSIQNAVGFMYSVAIQLVDDYTFNIVIVKTEPGIEPMTLIAIAIIAGVIITGILAWHNARISEINLQVKALDSAKPAIDIAADAYQRYTKEVEQCDKDDMDCVRRTQYKWYPFIQGASALAGSIIATGMPVQQQTECNGINISGVCVPWWVVAIAVFLAGLLVISAVK
jgi:hypothetical protein